MIDMDELVKRNAGFAAGHSFAGLRLSPSGSLQVIGCVDPRVDPADVLGLKLGEAAVIRSGLAYDVATGLVETIVPPARVKG